MKRREGGNWEPTHRAAVRHRVAIEAARMLYHREVREYLHAKREAARRLGTAHLPSNLEVHEQILVIARRVDGDEPVRRLAEMRRLALGLMELLEPFQPRLIGSVLTGHIRRGSDIDLHVYTEEVEAMCGVLEGRGHEIVVETVHVHKHGEPADFTHVRLPKVGSYEVEITVYPVESLHVAPRCSITGKPMKRATIAEVRRLLEGDEEGADGGGLAGQQLVLRAPLDRDEVLRLVPELAACRGVLQNHYHHLDVFEHTWAVVEGLQRLVTTGFERFGALPGVAGRFGGARGEPGRHASRPADTLQERLRKRFEGPAEETFLYLAGICHDLGKPATQSFDRDGRIRFFGHEHQGAELVGAIGRRLGLDAATSEDLRRVVGGHLEAVRIPVEGGEPSRIRRLLAGVGERLPELALLSLCDVEASRGPAQSEARIEEHEEFARFLLEEFFEGGFLVNPVLPLADEDLVEQFGELDARTLGRLRADLLDAFVDGEFEGREEGLAVASEFLERPGPHPRA